MQTIVECVPNFSEGRDAAKIEAIIQALVAGPDVYLLDQEMDADHNRSVITLAGGRESIGEAALRGISKAAELIDLNHHQGAHPRLGATDVVPFVPVHGVTLEDCVRIAEWVAEETWRRFRIPTYLYEAAARRPERRNLENIRRGEFEGLREALRTQPDRLPDFGEASLHPTAGATVVGARKFLIAWNVNLATSDLAFAKSVARKVRASSGGFPCVKAMGVELRTRGLVQVSMNLTDFETTPLATVFDAVAREAAAHNVSVEGSEIIGLIPRQALEDAAVHCLRVENFHSDLVFENRLQSVLTARAPQGSRNGRGASLEGLAKGFVDAVAAESPTPGGGSVAALAGALAAALGEMVCRLTLKRKSLARHHAAVEESLARLGAALNRLMEAVDRDARSYEAVIAAKRMPRNTEEESRARLAALEEATYHAALVPLETARDAAEVAREIESLGPVTLAAAASDLAVARHLAAAARRAALENVRTNLPDLENRATREQIESQLRELEGGRPD